MRLRQLQLNRFKAFQRCEVELGSLAVVVGVNNAGKSSLLHAIALLSQSVEGNSLRTSGPVVDLGQDAAELVHRDDESTAAGAWDIGLTWEGDATEIVPEPLSFGRVRVTLGAHFTAPSSFETDMRVSVTDPFGREVVVTAPSPSSGAPTNILRIEAERFASIRANAAAISIEVRVLMRSPFAVRAGVIGVEPAAVERGDPQAVGGQALRIAAPLLDSFVTSTLRSFLYVGANRHVDRSQFPLGAEVPARIVTAGDLVTTLAYRPDLLRRVSSRCEEIFGYGIEIALVPSQQVSLVALSGPRRLNIMGMGSGFIQLMWVLTMLEIASTSGGGGTPAALAVGIEEPELHLHPALQPKVAHALSHFVRAGLQVICTTQSEHLLMSILTMLLSRELAPDQVSIHYVTDGRVEPLRVNERGQIAGGLRGFFEANEDELKRYIDLGGRACPAPRSRLREPEPISGACSEPAGARPSFVRLALPVPLCLGSLKG